MLISSVAKPNRRKSWRFVHIYQISQDNSWQVPELQRFLNCRHRQHVVDFVDSIYMRG